MKTTLSKLETVANRIAKEHKLKVLIVSKNEEEYSIVMEEEKKKDFVVKGFG